MGKVISRPVMIPTPPSVERPHKMRIKYKSDMPKKLKNYITLTEVYLNNGTQNECNVSIKPSDIICMKDVKSEKWGDIKTSVFLKNFNNPCQGFNFDGPILVKETREDIDSLIEKFYSEKKRRPGPE